LNFDDLFGLLLFVVFIALPALSRMAGSKKPGGGASPGQGAPTQGTPTQGRTSTASTARPSSPTPGAGTATTAGGGDELERRLAEARERVRRALEGPGSSSSTPASGGAPSARRPTAPAQAAARPKPPQRRGQFVSKDRDDGLLSTPLDPNAVGMLGGRDRAAPRAKSTRFAEAPALQIERPGARDRSGPRAGRTTGAFATDPETIRAAIVWHQILGEPRARRPLGGRPSTLRSR
jgi:hypothetical protein